MNYYDEEIEINRESTKETGHIASAKMTRGMSLKGNSSPNEPSVSKESNIEPINSKSNNNTNIAKINKNDKNSKKNIDSSESETEDEEPTNQEIQQKNYTVFTSDRWKSLSIPQDLKDVMQNILKYAPQTIDTEYKLQPFMPDFVPSVGDVDAFLKVSCPDSLDINRKKEIEDFMLVIGLSVLDEPSGRQSDPNLLSMKLRSVFTNPGVTNMAARVPTARTAKDIDKWINEMDEIHRDQSINRINSIELNDEINIDNLMAEWPKSVEVALNENEFPPPEIDCSLESYLKIISALFDIPILEYNSTHYLKAIHVLFNLYLAVNEAVDFK